MEYRMNIRVYSPDHTAYSDAAADQEEGHPRLHSGLRNRRAACNRLCDDAAQGLNDIWMKGEIPSLFFFF